MTDGSRAVPSEEKPAPAIDRVLQDSSLYLLGNIASRVVGFLAIPFYARFLSPAQYGLIELIELSTQTLAIALGLQAIGAALSRLFHDQPTRESEQAVVSTSLIATAVLSAVVTIGAVAGAGALSRLVFHSDEWVGLIRAAFIAMFFSNMIEVVLVYERIRANARFFLWYTMITLCLTLGLNILFIGVLDAGVWGFVSSKLVVTIAGSLFLMFRMRRDVGWHWRSFYVPELVRFGAPLVLSSLSYFAIHFSDRFFLSSSVSLAELGRYALAYRFAILVSALVGDSFAKSWNATLYRYIDRDGWRAQFARIASYFTYILFVTGVAIALFSPELLRIMVPPDYFPPPLLLPIIIASYLAREVGDFFRSLLLINKRSVRVGQIAFCSALLNLAANAVLIPTYGIYGAAVATFLTWFVYMLVCWVVANREHKLPVRPIAYVRIAALVVVIYALAVATRVPGFLIQVVLDGFWVMVFAGLAFGLFLSSEERRGAMALAGSLLMWAVVRNAAPGEAPPGGKRRLLALAYYYPPENEIGAARPDRFVRYLRRAGMDVTVVTAAALPPGRTRDVDTVHAPGLRKSRNGQATAAPQATRSIRLAAVALHGAERLILPYDDRMGWLPYAYAAAAPCIDRGTILFSTHPPTVTHLTAMALKHRYGVPWIADFRDPLWGNPYRTSQRAAMLDPLLERLTIETADAVIANTEAAGAELRRRYPLMAEKVHVIWNGFDPEDAMVPTARAAAAAAGAGACGHAVWQPDVAAVAVEHRAVDRAGQAGAGRCAGAADRTGGPELSEHRRSRDGRAGLPGLPACGEPEPAVGGCAGRNAGRGLAAAAGHEPGESRAAGSGEDVRVCADRAADPGADCAGFVDGTGAADVGRGARLHRPGCGCGMRSTLRCWRSCSFRRRSRSRARNSGTRSRRRARCSG